VTIAGVRFFGLIRGVIRYFERVMSHNAALRMLGGMRVQILRKLVQLPGPVLRKLHSGSLLRSVDQDTDEMDMLLPGVIFPLVSSLLVVLALPWLPPLRHLEPWGLLAGGLWLLWIFPWLFWGFLPGTPHLEKLEELGLEAADNRHDLLGTPAWQETMQNIENISEKIMQTKRSHLLRVRLLGAFQNALFFLWPTLLLLLTPWQNGSATAWSAAAIFGLLGAGELFGSLPAVAGQAKSSWNAWNHIESLHNAGINNSDQGSVDVSKEGVTLRHLSFCYSGSSQAVLHDVSAHISPGSYTAILGSVGSGKTTLLELLTGFLPIPQGMLWCGSTDLSMIPSAHLTQSYAYLSQRSHIFTGTVRENLQLSRANLDDSTMEAMLELTGFPVDGSITLDSYTGENGALFSGGERQRLLLARTLLLERPVLLLDEPFNNLDKATRARLRDWLVLQKGRLTVILVSHQEDGLDLMDQIIRLPEAKVLP
jgi:ATP-binding cassette, subfamily C, bacterial CydC